MAGGMRPSYQEVMDNPVDYIWVSHVYSVVPDDRVNFQLSQRADHIIKTVASRVRFNRALINPKWEISAALGYAHVAGVSVGRDLLGLHGSGRRNAAPIRARRQVGVVRVDLLQIFP